MAVVLRALAMIAASTLVAGLASGCGSDSDGAAPVATDTSSSGPPDSTEPSPTESSSKEPSETAAPASWPACREAWVAGADLPSPYRGCVEDEMAVPAESIHCSTGAVLVRYDDRFWGVPGHVISRSDGPLKRDRDYRLTLATCTA